MHPKHNLEMKLKEEDGVGVGGAGILFLGS